jgi:hypothetical protein
MIITLFLCIICFNYDTLNIIKILITITILFIGSWIDHRIFPEEFSTKKIIGRSLFLCINLLLLYYLKDYIIVDYIMFCIGYAVASISDMLFMKNNLNTAESKLENNTTEN